MRSMILVIAILLITACDGQDPSQTYTCSQFESDRVSSETRVCIDLHDPKNFRYLYDANHMREKCYQDTIMRICHARFDKDRPDDPFSRDTDVFRHKETFPLAPIPENVK